MTLTLLRLAFTGALLLLNRVCFSLGYEYESVHSMHFDSVSRDLSTNTTNSTNDLYVDLHDLVNPPWDELKATLIIGTNSNGPALGSTIRVNHSAINFGSTTTYSQRNIQSNVVIHTPTSTYIGRKYFSMQTRWYQEDNNTQIFRMFPGDDNVCTSRTGAPRVESFNNVSWKRGDGWYEFTARYTFLLLRAATVFQIKHNDQFWSMQLEVALTKSTGTWDLIYKKLDDLSARRVVQTDVLNKSFDIRVMDDGTYHKVFINNEFRLAGNMTDRLDTEQNKARWGFYSAGSAIDRDILLFVTGAFVGPYITVAPTRAPTVAPTKVPIVAPTRLPTKVPTVAPTMAPITASPASTGPNPTSISPSQNLTLAIHSCAAIIRSTCSLRQFYLGNNCWYQVVDSQCPSLGAYKSIILKVFAKTVFRRCVRIVGQRCSCDSTAQQCSQRLGRQICKFPVVSSTEGAVLYNTLWKQLAQKCGGISR